MRAVAVLLLPIACSAGADTGGTGLFASSVTATASDTAPASSDGADDQGNDDHADASAGEVETSAAPGSSGSADDASADETAGSVCGDDNLQPGEDCDGMSFGDNSCASLGFDDGVLACDADCHVLTDACFTCGDGDIALSEVCDGINFGGETCASQGFLGGALSCTADCSALVTTQCQPLPSCGDGVRNGGEQCDGDDLGANSCISLGFDLGTVSCTAACILDSSDCMDDLSNCGMMGDFCLFDENDVQSTCCPAGVGGNVLGICDVFLCV